MSSNQKRNLNVLVFFAVFTDRCGQCVGGNTGRSLTYKIDCAGKCDKHINDSVLTCGKCLSKDKEKRPNFTDCTGTCFGGAKINL